MNKEWMKRSNGESAGTGFAPTPERERLAHIDVMRGIALLGVLMINVDLFCGAFWAMEAHLPYPLGWGGNLLVFLRRGLVEGKAVALLSMLFGAGMMMQVERSRSRSQNHLPFTLRRLGILALIGIAHSFLLWNGDILIDYALMGLLVLPFLRLPRARVLWAVPLLIIVALLIFLPFSSIVEQVENNPARIQQMDQQYYGNGTWLEALKLRSWQMIHVMGPLRIGGRLFVCLPLFVLGIFFYNIGFLTRPARHKRPLWILFASCLAVGLAANLVPPERVYAWTGGIPFRPLRVFLKLLFLFGREGLVVGYMSGLLLAAEWWNRKGKDSLLAAMGRMALTQYLLQSLACSLVFYGFGLGLFGKVPLNLCILGSILFFLFQAWTSRLWLKHFHSGPVEWLWRSLVYRTRPPFRRTRSSMIQTGAPEAG